MIYEMVILMLPPILVLIYMFLEGLEEQGKYYAFIFFITVFPLTALRRKMMRSKRTKRIRSILKTSGNSLLS